MVDHQTNLLDSINTLEEILASSRAALGEDFVAYRNHCYRVANLCRSFPETTSEDNNIIVIATAFHDLGIWAFQTFDYLDGSRELARRYLMDHGQVAWAPEVEAMIGYHHKITAFSGDNARLVEAFRKADWVDISLGHLRFGLSKEVVTNILTAFPNSGFHKKLVGLTFRRLRRHPLSPLPMMKF
jgi:hypothetical protein